VPAISSRSAAAASASDLLGHAQEAVQFAVMRGDSREQRLGRLDRRQLAPVIEAVQLGDCQKRDIHRGVLAVWVWRPS
jgi:hypothetical protein